MIKLILLWLLFFFSHSFLATPSVKTALEPIFKNKYRLFYNGVAAILMALIMYHLLRMRSNDVFIAPPFLKWLGQTILTIGAGISIMAFKEININSFLGLSSADESSGKLITEGVYALVRHPLYFGLTLSSIGIFLIVPTDSILLSVVFSILYIIIGIEFEEKKLRQQFGTAYDDFARGKKKFLPYLY
jgi:protein-S-isoprenylcysteine O-methyltransferase Ste14